MSRPPSFLAPALLAWEANHVIALRLAKLALGGPAALTEANQMMTEKVAATMKAATMVSAAMMRGTPDAGAAQVVRMLRREVRANKRRLSE